MFLEKPHPLHPPPQSPINLPAEIRESSGSKKPFLQEEKKKNISNVLSQKKTHTPETNHFKSCNHRSCSGKRGRKGGKRGGERGKEGKRERGKEKEGKREGGGEGTLKINKLKKKKGRER